MTPEIEKRIKLVQTGKVPSGYKKTRIGVVPKEWRIGDLSEVLELTLREVEKPSKPYWRVGVRSWAKGTFRAYVDDPSSVDMDTLYQVKENDLVVSITFAWEHAIALATKEDDGLLVSHRFPTYVFKKNHLPIFYQKIVSQPIFKYMLELVSPGGAGRNRVLDKKNFIKLPCPILKFKEQEKIAEILAAQDQVIELKEKLVAEKQKLKKFLMNQFLFDKKGSESFSRFNIDGVCIDKAKWKKKKFEDVFEFYSTNSLSRDNLTNDVGCFKNIHYGDILVKYSEILDVSSIEIPYIKSDVDCSKLVLLKSGDIVIADTAEDYTAGKVVEIQNVLNEKVVAGLHTMMCRPKEPIFASRWLGFYMNSNSYHDQLIPLITSMKVSSIAKKEIVKTIVIIPSLPEQQAIAKVLSAADEEISLLQKDLEQEKLKKKSLMQLLLSGLVRVSA